MNGDEEEWEEEEEGEKPAAAESLTLAGHCIGRSDLDSQAGDDTKANFMLGRCASLC